VKLALVLGALAVSGCGASSAVPLVTVQQLLAQCDAYKGTPVRLAGYLGECAGYECHVAIDKAHYARWVGAFNATLSMKHNNPAFSEAWSRVDALWPVGVGGNPTFDSRAGPLQNSYVVITGRVAKSNCTGAGGTDRSAGIEPTDIRAWTPSEGAPANTH
jgi:hypothetical protein